MLALGEILSYAFLVTLLALEILGIVAAFGIGKKWSKKRPRLRKFLLWNGAINQALTTLVVIGLLVYALVDSASNGLTRMIEWASAGPLTSTALALLFFIYIFMGVAKVLSDTATEEATPLVNRGLAPLISLLKKGRRTKQKRLPRA